MRLKVIGIDIDGTLDVYGDFFEASIPAWQAQGIKVGIITSRLESDKPVVAEALEKVGLKLDFLFFQPNEFEKLNIPHGVWKGILCRVAEVDILFDDMERDDPAFLSDFTQVVGNTQVFTPVIYKEAPDSNGKTTAQYAEEMIHALQGKKV